MPTGEMAGAVTACPESALNINTMKSQGVRSVMKDYWRSHSKEGTVKEMMLDENAEILLQDEQPEVMGMIPAVKDKDVIELGAGIGRFTKLLSDAKAKNVLAVEFMDNFMEKNKEDNGGAGNVDFYCGDVLSLERGTESTDLVFSNWLLMYLNDDEVQLLIKKVLSWLRVGGHAYFRESCFHESGNKARSNNPTLYRSPATYMALFNSVVEKHSDGNTYGFELEFSKSVKAYIKHKNNPNQICWLLKKTKVPPPTGDFANFQQFLDNQQYSRNSILRYEAIFGKHYVSTGGKDTTEELIKMLDLKPEQKVLDVGAGIGGSAFLMNQDYGATVHGVDLSSNMISIALERLAGMPSKTIQECSFEVADATKQDYPAGSFDVVYSRDTILHIQDKEALFTSFLRWLKPGGKLLITDYCCSPNEHSEAFKQYVAQRGYDLLSPAAYGKVLEKVGFEKVLAKDNTDMFVHSLKTELTRTEGLKDKMIQEFSEEDYNYIVDGWRDKLVRVGQGCQRWGLFYAEKPN